LTLKSKSLLQSCPHFPPIQHFGGQFDHYIRGYTTFSPLSPPICRCPEYVQPRRLQVYTEPYRLLPSYPQLLYPSSPVKLRYAPLYPRPESIPASKLLPPFHRPPLGKTHGLLVVSHIVAPLPLLGRTSPFIGTPLAALFIKQRHESLLLVPRLYWYIPPPGQRTTLPSS